MLPRLGRLLSVRSWLKYLYQWSFLKNTDLLYWPIYLYTFRRISKAKKSPHTYHVADVCSHREIEHASEVNEGKFECYQTWFLSYSKSNFSWKMKRGDKRTYICSIYTFLVLPPPPNKPPFKLRRKTTYLASRSFVILELLIFYVTKLNWTLQMFTGALIGPLNKKTNVHYYCK